MRKFPFKLAGANAAGTVLTNWAASEPEADNPAEDVFVLRALAGKVDVTHLLCEDGSSIQLHDTFTLCADEGNKLTIKSDELPRYQ